MLVCPLKRGRFIRSDAARVRSAKSTARGRAVGIVANQPVISNSSRGVGRTAVGRWSQAVVAVVRRVMEIRVFAAFD